MTPSRASSTATPTRRALVLHPYARAQTRGRAPDARLAEADSLARAIRLRVVETHAVRTLRPRPATLFGSGTVSTIAEVVAGSDIEITIVDASLTPVQQRNLEVAWACKVIDRTGLILEIFGARARTREGKLQVELAALSYQKGRLVRSWTHLERQRGGYGFLGGPGESQIEADRRQIDERIAKIGRDLQGVRRTRSLHRRGSRARYPLVALVGYTNAGKSTLFNRLTGAGVRADDQLFATLDPKLRRVASPGGRCIIVSDTVGFVSELPTTLIAAFSATLEEVREADAIVHVRDVVHPDSEAQDSDVREVLRQIADGSRVAGEPIEALNKIDLATPANRVRIRTAAARRADQVPISATTGEGCEALLEALQARLFAAERLLELDVALADGAAIAWLYAHGEICQRNDEGNLARLQVRLSDADAQRFLRRAPVGGAARL